MTLSRYEAPARVPLLEGRSCPNTPPACCNEAALFGGWTVADLERRGSFRADLLVGECHNKATGGKGFLRMTLVEDDAETSPPKFNG